MQVTGENDDCGAYEAEEEEIMPKEQVLRSIVFTERDEELRRKYQSIVDKYEGKGLTEEEYERAVWDEVISLAKGIGFDTGTGNFRELLYDSKQLTDEELDAAVGGKGQFTRMDADYTYTYSCELVTGDATFLLYLFNRIRGCANYQWDESASNTRSCADCKHLCVDKIPKSTQ